MRAKAHKTKTYQLLGQQEQLPQSAVIKFVKAPDGFIYLDGDFSLTEMPAVYIAKTAQALSQAVNEGQLEQALNAQLKENTYQDVMQYFDNKLAQAIHLSRKSGRINIGFDQVKTAKNIAIVVDENLSPRVLKELEHKAQKLNCPVYQLPQGHLEKLVNLENAKVVGLLKGAEFVLDCLHDTQALSGFDKK